MNRQPLLVNLVGAVSPHARPLTAITACATPPSLSRTMASSGTEGPQIFSSAVTFSDPATTGAVLVTRPRIVPLPPARWTIPSGLATVTARTAAPAAIRAESEPDRDIPIADTPRLEWIVTIG